MSQLYGLTKTQFTHCRVIRQAAATILMLSSCFLFPVLHRFVLPVLHFNCRCILILLFCFLLCCHVFLFPSFRSLSSPFCCSSHPVHSLINYLLSYSLLLVLFHDLRYATVSSSLSVIRYSMSYFPECCVSERSSRNSAMTSAKEGEKEERQEEGREGEELEAKEGKIPGNEERREE